MGSSSLREGKKDMHGNQVHGPLIEQLAYVAALVVIVTGVLCRGLQAFVSLAKFNGIVVMVLTT